VPFHLIEDEELGFRSEQRGIRDAGGAQVFLGAVGDRARVAAVAQHGGGLDDIAADDDGGVVGKGIEDGGAVVRHQHHVRFVDALPAGDRRAVEHLAILEEAVVHFARRQGNVLLLALGVREAQVDPASLGLFNQLQRL